MQNPITLAELESAINFWRKRSPSVGEELRLCPEASALATPYAMMILGRRTSMMIEEMPEKSQAAIKAWKAETAVK